MVCVNRKLKESILCLYVCESGNYAIVFLGGVFRCIYGCIWGKEWVLSEEGHVVQESE